MYKFYQVYKELLNDALMSLAISKEYGYRFKALKQKTRTKTSNLVDNLAEACASYIVDHIEKHGLPEEMKKREQIIANAMNTVLQEYEKQNS